MIELLGTTAMLIAISGVVLNNRKSRWCFGLWLVSNAISAFIHVRVGVWSLVVRDIVFIALACEGWWLWGRRRR